MPFSIGAVGFTSVTRGRRGENAGAVAVAVSCGRFAGHGPGRAVSSGGSPSRSRPRALFGSHAIKSSPATTRDRARPPRGCAPGRPSPPRPRRWRSMEIAVGSPGHERLDGPQGDDRILQLIVEQLGVRHGDVPGDGPPYPQRLPFLLASRAEEAGSSRSSPGRRGSGRSARDADGELIGERFERGRERQGATRSPRIVRRLLGVDPGLGGSRSYRLDSSASIRSARNAWCWCGAGSSSDAASGGFLADQLLDLGARGPVPPEEDSLAVHAASVPQARVVVGRGHLDLDADLGEAQNDPLRPRQHALLQLQPRAGVGVRRGPFRQVCVEVGAREAKRIGVGRRAHSGVDHAGTRGATDVTVGRDSESERAPVWMAERARRVSPCPRGVNRGSGRNLRLLTRGSAMSEPGPRRHPVHTARFPLRHTEQLFVCRTPWRNDLATFRASSPVRRTPRPRGAQERTPDERPANHVRAERR